MRESQQRRRRRSKPIKEQLFPNSRLGRAVWALSEGVKPARWLSDRVKEHGGKCTERHANLLIEGKRKPGTRVALVLLNEIIS
jgi:hypothetical protein